MREIKFRGKRVDNGDWVYGSLIIIGVPFRENEYCIAPIFSQEEAHRVIPETVGQYTGIKDKNGVDVYEGDIIECESYEYGKFTRNILWCSKDALWVATNDPIPNISIWGNDELWEIIRHNNAVEVIGNIHDKDGE